MSDDDDMARLLAGSTLTLAPDSLTDLDADLEREWLVTNGLGGYALGTVAGATTRAYHGLLVAAVNGPSERRMLVTKLDEVVTLASGETVALGTNEWASDAIAPLGYQRLAAFSMDAGLPRWTYRLPNGGALTKQIWMEHGENLTYVRYQYSPASAHDTITLTLTPFCLERDHNGNTRGSARWRFEVRSSANACAIQATSDLSVYRLIAAPQARFVEQGEWYWGVLHRKERERGLPDTEDVYVPGSFATALAPEQQATLALWAGDALPDALAELGGETHEAVVEAAFQRERSRRADLLRRAGEPARTVPDYARLVLAADQFIVARPDPDTKQPGVTIIAGYPWFTDWGRDTMISLPGLTLATGRHEDAAALLRTFARYVSQGMIPNRFPDITTSSSQCGPSAAQSENNPENHPENNPEYNTVDATLWYFQALRHYLAATRDHALLAELFPTLAGVIDWHVRGTRYGIIMDPRDGLLRSGAEGVQLTWMDARVDGWVVTPRRGKPVEISALWYAALAQMEEWSGALRQDGSRYAALRKRVEASFYTRYWYAAGAYLYDVVDADGVDGVNDWSLRPNQLIALAVAPRLLPPPAAASIMRIAAQAFVTPLGLRTLAPADPRFTGAYRGDQRSRDAAYHQGTAWPWLVGVLAEGSRVTGICAEEVMALLTSLRDQLTSAGVGTLSEIADGAPPYHPCGCVAQAWSVAETLRVLWERSKL